MLRSRIIPCLLVHDHGLVKTVGFGSPKYVGDPLNAVRIFNEKSVDELMVLDIDATVNGVEPDYELIEQLAAECRMPLCYGGGVKSALQIEQLVSLGVEKVALSSVLAESPELITEAAASVGAQSIVAVIDVKRTGNGYTAFTHNGTRSTGADPASLAERYQALGAGEIMINSIDRDGTMMGYDLDLIGRVRAAVDTPLTALGGAGSLDDIERLISEQGTVGAAAGSLFVFKGSHKAVLINYPSLAAKERLFETAMAAAV